MQIAKAKDLSNFSYNYLNRSRQVLVFLVVSEDNQGYHVQSVEDPLDEANEIHEFIDISRKCKDNGDNYLATKTFNCN